MKTAIFRPADILFFAAIAGCFIGCNARWNVDNPIVQCGIIQEPDYNENEQESSPWTLFRLSPWEWWGNDVYIVSLVPYINKSEAQTGLAVAGVGNCAKLSAHGVQIAGVVNAAEDSMNGLQIGAFNMRKNGCGLSIGAVNDLFVHHNGNMCGAQIGFLNCITSSVGLLQIGLMNDLAGESNLFQIGVYNKCEDYARPPALLQVGLWNDNGVFPLPLINVRFSDFPERPKKRHVNTAIGSHNRYANDYLSSFRCDLSRPFIYDLGFMYVPSLDTENSVGFAWMGEMQTMEFEVLDDDIRALFLDFEHQKSITLHGEPSYPTMTEFPCFSYCVALPITCDTVLLRKGVRKMYDEKKFKVRCNGREQTLHVTGVNCSEKWIGVGVTWKKYKGSEETFYWEDAPCDETKNEDNL